MEEQPPPEYPYSASLGIIYFGVGFVVGAVLAVVLATALIDPRTASQPVRIAAMLAPLGAGALIGVRTVLAGRTHHLPLGRALKKAFFLG